MILIFFSANIAADKDGPIHDVTWSPNSKEFGVVYGYMPAKATLFNTRAVATHSFPLAPRNTINFSPNGRFVLVAGFGNLAGQMDIYDLEKDHKKLCTIEASNASVCEWSPDGKHILTATTSPRLRVDNGVRIWHVGGGLMYNEDLTELYHVTWRPQTLTSQPSGDPLHPIPTPHASALQYLGTVKTPSKPAGAYRPPGARGQVTPIAFRREDEGGAAFVSDGSLSHSLHAAAFGKPRRREVPGAEPITSSGQKPPGIPNTAEGDDNLSKAAAKNKKKREAKKAKDATDKSAGLAPSAESAAIDSSPGRGAGRSPGRSPERRDRRGHERNRSSGQTMVERPRSQQRSKDHPRAPKSGPAPYPQQPQQPQQTQPPQQSQVQQASLPAGLQPIITNDSDDRFSPPSSVQDAPDVTVTSPGGSAGSAHEKKVRALLKKLRAIDDLKMRRAGGEKLEGTQIKKMATEDEVRKDLEGLGWKEY